MKTGRLKYLIKSIVSECLHYSGLLQCFRCYILKKNYVLMYHRIIHSPNEEAPPLQPGMYVTEKTFEMHLQFLKKTLSIIPLHEMVSRISRGQTIGRCCCISFDDGWRDTYDMAFPLLKRYQVPASVFLATGYIGTDKWFWPEELAWCLGVLLKEDIRNAEAKGLIKHFFPGMNENRLKNQYDFIDEAVEQVKRYLPDQREALLGSLRKALPGRSKDRRLMNWDEVAEMHKSGLVSFGAHTMNHVYLDQVEQETALLEISSSKQIIEDHLGTPVTLFAYPNGNYTLPVARMLEQNDFFGAVTTKRGYVDKNTPLMEIPRIGVHEDVSNTTSLLFSRLLFRAF